MTATKISIRMMANKSDLMGIFHILSANISVANYCVSRRNKTGFRIGLGHCSSSISLSLQRLRPIGVLDLGFGTLCFCVRRLLCMCVPVRRCVSACICEFEACRRLQLFTKASSSSSNKSKLKTGFCSKNEKWKK